MGVFLVKVIYYSVKPINTRNICPIIRIMLRKLCTYSKTNTYINVSSHHTIRMTLVNVRKLDQYKNNTNTILYIVCF